MNKIYEVYNTIKCWLWVVLAIDAWLHYCPGLTALEAKQLALETFNQRGGISSPDLWKESPYGAVEEDINTSPMDNEPMVVGLGADFSLLQFFTK